MSDTSTLLTDAPTDAPATQATSTATATPAAPADAPADHAPAAPAGDKPADKPATETEDAPKGAPEAYEFKPVEGAEFQPAVLEAFADVAKELDLTQDNAQKVLAKVGPVMAKVQAEAVQKLRTEWVEQTQGDKDIGGEKLAANVALAQKAVTQFGTPELKALLGQTGLGNHPEFVRAFAKIGQAISEDKVVVGGRQTTPGTTGRAEKLYPTQAAA